MKVQIPFLTKYEIMQEKIDAFSYFMIFFNPHRWSPIDEMGLGDPSTIFFATIFTQKMPELSSSMYSSILILKKIWIFEWKFSNSNSLMADVFHKL